MSQTPSQSGQNAAGLGAAGSGAAGPGALSRCPFPHGAATAAVTPAAAGCPVSANAAAFDPFSDGYQQDPPEYVRWAREQEPVFYSPQLGYWVVTRYDDIKAIFRDNLTFSPSIALEKITPTGPEANAVLASYGFALNRTLVNEDEPAHMPRRRALMEPFTPEHLKHHEPMVRKLTREYVDRFIDDGRADLVDQMLWEVPLTVALHFLGVPEEDMDLLRKYSIAHTVNTWGRPRPEEQVAVAHAVGNFWQFAGKVLDKMRQNPDGPGWMQYGIRKQKDHPDVVTDSYLHSMMMAGIVAAHETTANATANAMKLLLQHPHAWREICEDPSLIPNAVEECLRHNGSVAAWRRLATKDVQIGGIDIPAGSKLLIVTSSANHDERHFADADLFDIRRDNASDHVTFGYGSHQCMGKNLARMEMQIFLEEFTRRLPHMRLAEQTFSYVPNTSFRGPEHVLVEWDPAQNPERVNAAVRDAQVPVRIGEPSAHALSRPVVVERVEVPADGIVHLRLVAPDGATLPRWAPGAHIDVECGDTGLSRQYSLCGDPADTRAFEIAVLREAQSRGGSAWVHDTLRVGARLKIRGPRNHFRLDEEGRRAIFIAGGIGITPVSAMARRARELGIDYELHYSGRSRATMAFVDELTQLHGERFHLHVSDEGSRNDFAALNVDDATRVYACGPACMLEALESCSANWPDDALRVEHFAVTRGTLDPAHERAFEVELKDSGLVLNVAADQTVLDALRRANIDVQSDCEEGLCGSCEVRVLAGEIDHRDVVLTRAERDTQTRMMTCCSRAKCGRLVLEL
ncbi:cytochrome P450/oxidoreductase [Paraburkholderia acidisoli]|uniref:Cytochrome P450 n=1 Tax=Paraburkholderia acidisoli TaxID=2571748 RepID=A0A7Z2GHC6_9BURK|nr:cytochrome P450/oxidoreductase [Paraburkholderia acidisoli]QGZ61796.1 cytochrome P450 [Paraburkholderia acidisoli]